MTPEHEPFMQVAIVEAELARGSTGDNPWVGCVIISRAGAILARGHTRGPGEDHAEIGALRDARARDIDLTGSILYSTLEPCAFHGRTPACAVVIAQSGIGLLVTGIRDPHPRVDGAGNQIVRAAGIEVLEGVCAPMIRRQLAPWILREHPQEPLRRARAALAAGRDAVAELTGTYGLETAAAVELVCRARERP